jgi:cell division protein FtsA|tara:strand:+ start:693 stop:1901 length:1209 start_codon:yes stop_codon:yes gene_type:complete
MKIKEPYLFIEINDQNIIFFVVEYGENLDFKILDTTFVKSEGVLKGKIIDVSVTTKIIKDNLKAIEKKIDFIFYNATIVSDQYNYDCINVSGFKKLGGSQILKEDVSFVINNMKKIILGNNLNKNLIHLFNSRFMLDNTVLDKAPLNLFGEYYNQQLTFLLLFKSDIKNIKLVLGNCNISIDRIVLKSFVDAIYKIANKKIEETCMMIDFKKNISQVRIFKNLSFSYSESFAFGTDMLIKDVSKLCSLDIKNVKLIFSDICFGEIETSTKDKYLSKKYFSDINFRKISLEHIKNIFLARIKEIVNIVYKKNVNLASNKNFINNIYLKFDDLNLNKSIQDSFYYEFPENKNIVILKQTEVDGLEACKGAAELVVNGWEKEALPIIQTKKTFIAKIFDRIFGNF